MYTYDKIEETGKKHFQTGRPKKRVITGDKMEKNKNI